MIRKLKRWFTGRQLLIRSIERAAVRLEKSEKLIDFLIDHNNRLAQKNKKLTQMLDLQNKEK